MKRLKKVVKKKRRKNPKDDQYVYWLALAVNTGRKEDLFNVITYGRLFKWNDRCDDCGKYLEDCDCEKCDECGYNICLCDLN